MKITMETKDLRKYYGKGESLVKAVDGIDLRIIQGEAMAIIGKSGSGKSTLLHMLGGLDNPTSGEVWVDGEDIGKLKEEQLAVFRRRKIGFIFQAFNLVPSLNVWENVVLPLGLDGQRPKKDFIYDILDTLGMTNRLQNLPSQLSGGQQQRVAIARAIATKPAILLADEPTGNLDIRTSDEVMTMLKMSARKYGQTLVVITHNEDIAQTLDRIVIVADGKVVSA